MPCSYIKCYLAKRYLLDGDYICNKRRMDNWKNTEPFVWNIALNHSGLPVMAFRLALSRFLGAESPVVNCKEFNLADGEFLPIYLGYFFVSVGVSEHFTMAVVYLIVFVFTFLSQTQYYNPIYLLFGYHYLPCLHRKRNKDFRYPKRTGHPQY